MVVINFDLDSLRSVQYLSVYVKAKTLWLGRIDFLYALSLQKKR